MKKLKVRLTFTEPLLGSSPNNEEIYEDFIGSKAPNAATMEEEIESIGLAAVKEKGMTVFPRMDDGVTPFIYDYHIKGFFKDSCGGLRRVKDSKSSKIKAYKKEIDKLIFPKPRCIPIMNYGEIGKCQRPLRAMTMQGERVSLACSEEIQAGAFIEFSILILSDDLEAVVREWLDYGELAGFGQWRNSGKGRFTWEEIQ